jgi:Uma2 family endonuclease
MKSVKEERIMTTRTPVEVPEEGTLAELLYRLGDVPPERIRMRPAPGTAREQDVIKALEAADKRLYELVDGVLVEKAMGTREALLAGIILHWLWDFLEQHDLGQPLGADGALRLMPKLVRIPDVSFVSWERLPGRELPDQPIADLVPDLAVEVLSERNTKGEIQRKLRDYFLAGVRLVWVIQPRTQTAEVYRERDRKNRVGKTGVLDGENVLPGFKLALSELFARAHRKPSRSSQQANPQGKGEQRR